MTPRLTLPVLAAVAAGLALCSVSIPSSAMAAAADDWNLTQPTIEAVGNQTVQYVTHGEGTPADPFVTTGAVGADSRTPEFHARATLPAQEDGTFVVTDLSDGHEICRADAPTDVAYDFACAPSTPLDIGTVKVRAHLISPRGEKSEESHVVSVYTKVEKPVATLESRDEATGDTTLVGTAELGAKITAYTSDDVRGETDVADDGSWKLTLPGVARGQHVYVSALKAGSTAAADAIWLPELEKPTAPTGTIRDGANGDSTLELTVPTGRTNLVVRTQDGRVVTGTYIQNADEHVAFTLRGSGQEVTYVVTTERDGLVSEPASFTAFDGIGQAKPDMPILDDINTAGSRSVVTTRVEPGAVVSVRDATGTLVAVRVAGSTGTAQIVVSGIDSKASGHYTLTQSTDRATSDALSFDIAGS